ncbi:MAG: hypothetical protein VYE68_06515 [Acidobacteriota bacterium]|nr:hypothetical protein [Acidobacteriota bacterium]
MSRRSFALVLVCACLIMPVRPGLAQTPDKAYPIFTETHLDAMMKTLGPNVAGVRRALADRDFERAKERAIRSREQLATTITFWRDRQRPDAVGWLRAALTQLDHLDTELSAEEPDVITLDAIASELGQTCVACHTVYREPDDQGGYRVNYSALR